MQGDPVDDAFAAHVGLARDATGRLVVRRYHGQDAVAIAVALVVPVLYVALLTVLAVLLWRVLPEPDLAWEAR